MYQLKKNYTKSNKLGKKIVKRIPYVGNYLISVVSRMKSSVKQMIIPGMYFEEIGFRYLGPVDGHNIADLEDLLSKAKELDGPTLIHVLTKKGKGYKYAEENPDRFHGVGPFDIETGKSTKEKKKDYSQVFGDKIVSMAKSNKRIVAITAAMKDGTGLAKFSQKYPDRFYDVGIAEQHGLTFAAGLASSGMVPFISLYSSFYQRGYDQVIHDICLQNLPVIICVDRAWIVGNDGDTNQGMFDLSFFQLIPNLIIMAPKNFEELEDMMEFAAKIKRPVVIRYPRGGEKEINSKSNSIKMGKSELISSGDDITIITIGNAVYKGIKVAEKLKEDGKTCDIINCRFLKPIDRKNIISSIEKTKRVAVIEDGTIVGGLSSAIKNIIAEEKMDIISSNYYAYPDKFIEHGSVDELEKKYKVDIDSIYKSLKQTICK